MIKLHYVCSILKDELQQPQTCLEKGELDNMLMRCLQILSNIVYVHIDKLNSTIKQADELVE